MNLNHSKTEVLSHPNADHTALKFLDGSVVPTTTQVKYLGSRMSWINPFHIAFYHRLGLTEEAFKKWYGTARYLVKLRYTYITPP